MEIRLAKLSDSKKLADYKNSLLLTCSMISRSEPTSMEAVKKSLKSDRRLILICEHNTAIAGASTIKKRDHKGIISITISPNFQGKGLGKKLLSASMKAARKKFCTKVFISNIYSENTSSIKFFEKNGFLLAGKIPKGFYKNGKYHDKLIYVKVV